MELPAEVRAAAMRSLMVAEHEMVDSVSRALLAERLSATERAAKIAEDYAKRAWAAQPSAQEAAVGAEHIAAAIRSQS
jgi:hypothetical protein